MTKLYFTNQAIHIAKQTHYRILNERLMMLCTDLTSLWNAYVSKVGQSDVWQLLQNFWSWNSGVSEQFMVLLFLQ